MASQPHEHVSLSLVAGLVLVFTALLLRFATNFVMVILERISLLLQAVFRRSR